MFTLPELPYAYDALSPVMSDRTLHFHHDKHHATYVKTTNELIEKGRKSPTDLESLIRETAKDADRKLFNNAAQTWNHAFFWAAMTPDRHAPTAELQDAIEAAFGGLAKLREAFVTQGAGHFGSGWVWLAAEPNGGLKVFTTHDAGDPLTCEGTTPLLVCDLWEHAYYLDHQNDRKGFLEAWFDALPNWRFASSQLAAAKGAGQAWRYPAASPVAVSKAA